MKRSLCFKCRTSSTFQKWNDHIWNKKVIVPLSTFGKWNNCFTFETVERSPLFSKKVKRTFHFWNKKVNDCSTIFFIYFFTHFSLSFPFQPSPFSHFLLLLSLTVDYLYFILFQVFFNLHKRIYSKFHESLLSFKKIFHIRTKQEKERDMEGEIKKTMIITLV